MARLEIQEMKKEYELLDGPTARRCIKESREKTKKEARQKTKEIKKNNLKKK